MLHFSGASALNPYHALPIVQQMPPLNPAPQTDLERETPGVGSSAGTCRLRRFPVLEDF